MKVEPLSKEIYELATKAGVESITLNFSGGSDEGFLDINFDPSPEGDCCQELEGKVDSWAWEVYSYSGAGDGGDYGDDIVYNLKDKTVTASEWFMERTDGEAESLELEIN